MPIVEPEVLMDGTHTLERCEEVTEQVLHAVFDALFEQRVALEGMLLKPNMVIAGPRLPARRPRWRRWRRRRLRTLARHVPPAVPGVVFLSGGQSHRAGHASTSTPSTSSTAPKPWKLSFSYGRALQDEALDGLARQGARTSSPASAPSITAPSATAPRRWAGTAASMESEAIERLRPDRQTRNDRGQHGIDDTAKRTPARKRKDRRPSAQAERRQEGPLAAKELELMNAYWRACNYLSVGMIYLKDNPLLRRPLEPEDIKHRLLGHWGASPALSFVWVHLNRLIVKHDLDVIFVAGPGPRRAGRARAGLPRGHLLARSIPDKSEDEEGMRKFFKQFSFPGHIGSHVTPETPGSIHEGGELGYSLSHAYGMALRQPRPDRRLRRRRRRSGDRAARDRVALEQVHQPGARRRGAADPEPQRLQDRQPDHPRAHQPRGARGAVRRLRLQALLRRGQRPGVDAPEDGRDAGARRRRDPRACSERRDSRRTSRRARAGR